MLGGFGALGVFRSQSVGGMLRGSVCPPGGGGALGGTAGEGDEAAAAPRVSSPLPTARPGPQVRSRDPGPAQWLSRPWAQRAHPAVGPDWRARRQREYPEALDFLIPGPRTNSLDPDLLLTPELWVLP